MEHRYCQHCGQAVQPEDAYCFQCGAELGTGNASRSDSLRTVGAAAIVAIVAVLENLAAIIYAEEMLELAGFEEELSVEIIQITGGIGLVLSLSVLPLCYYYYQRGYVEKRFFGSLLGLGILGFLFGNAITFLGIAGIGAYGLLVTLD